jgi:hypothetical protein
MSRTTPGQVQTLLAGDYDGATDLQQHCDSASATVDDLVQQASTVRGVSMLASRLELIERNLAAHDYVMTDQTYQSKTTQGASAQFQGKTDMYLEGSKYGMKAMRLDTSGCLQALYADTKRKVCQGFWLGKPPSQQIDYKDRD